MTHFDLATMIPNPTAQNRMLVHQCLLFSILCILCPLASAVPAVDAPGNTLTIGGDANYPPFERENNGLIQGFNIDLIKIIAARGSVSITHRLEDWPDTVEALKAGDVDIVPMFVSPDPARQQWTRY